MGFAREDEGEKLKSTHSRCLDQALFASARMRGGRPRQAHVRQRLELESGPPVRRIGRLSDKSNP